MQVELNAEGSASTFDGLALSVTLNPSKPHVINDYTEYEMWPARKLILQTLAELHLSTRIIHTRSLQSQLRAITFGLGLVTECIRPSVPFISSLMSQMMQSETGGLTVEALKHWQATDDAA